jgi:hypothetical protein
MGRDRDRAKPREARIDAHLGAVDGGDGPPPSYDAAQAPDGARWLGWQEDERIQAVRRHHLTAPLPHPLPPSVDAHSAIHAVIETQLAQNDPPEVRRALGRLLSEGLSRHDSVHALGTAFANQVWEMTQVEGADRNFDLEGYKRELEALDAARWRELVDGPEADVRAIVPPPGARRARARSVRRGRRKRAKPSKP